MTNPRIWILDRIEDGRVAVLQDEDGRERTVPRSRLPADAREGDALRETGPGADGDHPESDSAESSWILDPEATGRLRAEAEGARSSLRRGPSGPISL